MNPHLLLADDGAVSMTFLGMPIPVATALLTATVTGFVAWIATMVSEKSRFDYNFRLNKEYDRYCDLWEKLVHLRRAIGSKVDSLSGGKLFYHANETTDAFNACQQSVRYGEPFVSATVYTAARNIVDQSEDIITMKGELDELEKKRNQEDTSEQEAKIERELDIATDNIDRLFEEVNQAIRNRVTPK